MKTMIAVILFLALIAWVAPEFTLRNAVLICFVLTFPFIVGFFMFVGWAVNGVHDGILGHFTKIHWSFVKETSEYIMYENPDDPNHARFVNKENGEIEKSRYASQG